MEKLTHKPQTRMKSFLWTFWRYSAVIIRGLPSFQIFHISTQRCGNAIKNIWFPVNHQLESNPEPRGSCANTAPTPPRGHHVLCSCEHAVGGGSSRVLVTYTEPAETEGIGPAWLSFCLRCRTCPCTPQ